MKKEKRFHWWYIPLALLVILLLVIGGFLIYMRSMLGWKNLVAISSNFNLELSEEMRTWVIGANQRDYSTLPEVLKMEDGALVTTAEEFENRREEILQLFSENVYGPLPQSGFDTTFEVLEEGTALDGKAVRKQVKITVSTEKGSSDALLLMYLPANQETSAVVCGLNFNGNHTVLNDSAILPSYAWVGETSELEENRGHNEERWNVENSISRGYAVATMYCNDIAPDNGDTYNSRVISLFDEPEFKTVSAWAFGLLRGVDYLMQDAAIDKENIAVIGHSRLGKAAIWATANDPRIAVVFSNDSGNTGASLSRSNHGETVKSINSFFKHWFSSKYASYGNNVNALPVDQHLLLASIAPRKVYVACAEDDLWADPQGAWNSLTESRDAYLLYDMEVLDNTLAEGLTQPAADGNNFMTESMGYHCRKGWHEVLSEDWTHYLDYMDQCVTNR